jgi:hypothetical protein
MKKVILALAELYIDFELFYTITLWVDEINLQGHFNYKTAKEVLRLDMQLKDKSITNNEKEIMYVFIKEREHAPKLRICLVKDINTSTDEDAILNKLEKQFYL